MSDRQIAKNRIHRGLTAYLRSKLRVVGISLDEEMAQFALNGLAPFNGHLEHYMVEIINETFDKKLPLMKQWQEDHPDRNPYPPAFPERALKLVREAMKAEHEDDGSPIAFLMLLEEMCLQELTVDPFTPTDTNLEEA